MASSARLGTKTQRLPTLSHRVDRSFSRRSTNFIHTFECYLTDIVRDTHDLSLSPYQQQFFQGWVRAREAIPPPSLYPNSRDGIGPLMSSSRAIDLVQDAASDCSVVASLCAGVARAERGHDQVSESMGIRKVVLFTYEHRCSKINCIHSTNIWASLFRRRTGSISSV